MASRLDRELLKEMQLEVAVVEVLDCVCLKIYKKAWASPKEDALQAKSRIFFSIWLGDKSIEAEKVQYNIHALKLRHLPGYAIESRKFATFFRADFDQFKPEWPNVSVNYGPLTLMEGWIKIETDHFEKAILQLANRFLTLAPLVDATLAKFKK